MKVSQKKVRFGNDHKIYKAIDRLSFSIVGLMEESTWKMVLIQWISTWYISLIVMVLQGQPLKSYGTYQLVGPFMVMIIMMKMLAQVILSSFRM